MAARYSTLVSDCTDTNLEEGLRSIIEWHNAIKEDRVMSASTLDPNRRIIVGVTRDGRSTVAADARDIAEAEPLPGYRVQEVWNQPSLPAEVHDDGVTTDAIDIEPPREGALVRVLTIEPLSRDKWVPNPHGDSNRHVLTLVSGTIDLVLEDTEVTMTPGDSVVLSGHVHDWRNCHGVPAVLVYTTFPLRPGDSPAVDSRPMPTAFGE